jgi:L-lactate dehydrogenase (cytochrome)
MKYAAIADYRAGARRALPHFLYEYLDGGSFDEVTATRNITDLQSIALRQRVLRGVGSVDLSIDLLGENWAMPIALAPVGLAGINARRGEVQAARAASKADVPFCLSTVSVCSVDEVRRGVDRPFWFQLYMIRDRAFMLDLLAAATAAGSTTLVFTVDMPVPGTRYRDYRSGLAGAPGKVGALRRAWQAAQRPQWAWDVGLCGRPHSLGNIAPILGPKSGLEDFFAWMRANFDPGVTWSDLAWVRQHWAGRIIVKGIMSADDAGSACGAGADGIVVSNHGGRQLDGVPSTAAVLPHIVDAVDGRLPVMVDGGIRSGLDVVRLVALGASAVMIGRAWVYALAADGEAGVDHILSLIAEEMRVAMTLIGANNIADLNRDMIFKT